MTKEEAVLVNFSDNFQATINEIFKERGYSVKATIPKSIDVPNAMYFDMTTTEAISQEILNEIMEETIKRLDLGVKPL